MVRHLHDVDRPHRQRPGVPEPTLRRLPQVAEEDPGQARRTGVSVGRPRGQHDARVVAGGTVADQRPHHAPGERPEGAGDPVVRRPDVDTGTPEVVDHPFV
ncbi:hypothetical protein DEJ09_13765 [Curtobacterium sp. MCLR17_055]|nr:hypothetical protein DEJ09_13765 [Curtobacterium sp. MCLR17_055]